MKHLFIINPAAGKGTALKYVAKINEIFKTKDEEYEILVTEGEGHAVEIVRDRVLKDQYIVYSIGGDGTLNEVLNGIIDSDSTLAVIPAGSGNDFIRSITKGNTLKEILEKTMNGSIQAIDVAKLNNRYYINIASVGFDAVVAGNARKYKKKKFISGSMAYIVGVIEAFIKFRSIKASFEVNDKTYEDEMYLIAVANGKCYGGGLKIAASADVSDGLLDIYAIKKPSIISLIRFCVRVLRGKDISDIPEVNFIRCKKMRINCEDDVMLNIDGELSLVKEINIELIHKAVNVMIPQEYVDIKIKELDSIEGENIYETI